MNDDPINLQGGRGHWAGYYTSPKSFTMTINEF